jgi:hypothetical protein
VQVQQELLWPVFSLHTVDGPHLFFFIVSYNILKSSTNYRIGLKGIMVSAAPGTANTPRAHITNMAALGMLRSVALCCVLFCLSVRSDTRANANLLSLECLRDIGLDREMLKVACDGEQHMVHTRWCHSMAGEEYARIYSWGNDPRRKVSLVSDFPCAFTREEK